MTIPDRVASRGISEVLHFTTNRGLLGVFHEGAVLPRSRLESTATLEYILKLNSHRRRDKAWLDYVNLSIEVINWAFFSVCQETWHRGEDLWWVILSFSPEILWHPGVSFATTNNIYSGVVRGQGEEGLEALYGPRVLQYENRYSERTTAHTDAQPTCRQAEVLYPGPLSVEYLRSVYVQTEPRIDIVRGQAGLYGLADGLSVTCEPERFHPGAKAAAK